MSPRQTTLDGTTSADTTLQQESDAEQDTLLEKWELVNRCDLLTTYRYKTKIDKIQVKINIGTPQDGTWGIYSMIEVDPRGKAYLPQLTKGYNSRIKAEEAAVKIMMGLHNDQMVKQHILGWVQMRDLEPTIPAVVDDLTNLS